MMLDVNSSKTLAEFLKENPDFYKNVDGWAWNEDTQSWQNTGITDDLKELISDEFQDRYVCDDDKFARLFRNRINNAALRYANLSRIELTTFDPLVADYMERRAITASTTAQSKSNENSKTSINSQKSDINFTETPGITENITKTEKPGVSETVSETETPGVQETRKKDSTPGVTETKNTTSNPGITEHTESGTVGVGKTAPMSVEYAAAVAGNIPDLNWNTLSQQEQGKTKQDVTRSGSDNQVEVSSKEGHDIESDVLSKSGSNEKQRVSTKAGSDLMEEVRSKEGSDQRVESRQVDGNGTINDKGEESSNTAYDNDTKIIQTGRGGLTPQEALRTAVSYIKTSSAWEWMRNELNRCFMPVGYEPDDGYWPF